MWGRERGTREREKKRDSREKGSMTEFNNRRDRKKHGVGDQKSREKAEEEGRLVGVGGGKRGTRNRGRRRREKDASHGDETSKREGGKQKEDICSAPLKNRVF